YIARPVQYSAGVAHTPGKKDRCPDCHSHNQSGRRIVAFPLLIYYVFVHYVAACSRERAHSWHENASWVLPSFSSTIALLYQASGSSGASEVAVSKATSASFMRP